MALEIERKFLVDFKKCLPFLMSSNFKTEEIIQTYVERSEEKEIRVRKISQYHKAMKTSIKKVYFTKTIKYGEGLTREEFENEISEKEYLEEYLKSIGSLRKIRFYLADEGSCFDFYPFINLITFETEFETEDDAINYMLPEWLQFFVVEEITGNKDFSNFRLAKLYKILKLEA
jgi:CYTH domain-containing protein